MKKAQDLKVNDLFKSDNVILKVVNVTPTRVVYINTQNPEFGKRIMGFKQFNYWFPNGVELIKN